MAKKGKQIQQGKCSIEDCEIRPVTKNDKWCRRWLEKGQIPGGDAPWGYVIKIPYIPNQNTLLENTNGYYIVRCKKHCGSLLLQCVKEGYQYQNPFSHWREREYGIKSFSRDEPNVNKKKRKNKKQYRILNVRNFKKSDYNFPYRSEKHLW